MTISSLEELEKFLDNCDLGKDTNKSKCRVADYGGNDQIGSQSVKDLLAIYGLTNYHVLDFSTGVDLREPIPGEKFHIGICMDLLEHTSNPFVVAKNIIDSLHPGAYLYVTVPWVWPIHPEEGAYSDYWRFAPEGLLELFKEMETVAIYGNWDSYVPDEPEPPMEVFVPKLPWMRSVAIFKKK